MARRWEPMDADKTGGALPENAENGDWQRLTTEQLLSGYSESDSIYDAA
jgi:hypothetical protein